MSVDHYKEMIQSAEMSLSRCENLSLLCLEFDLQPYLFQQANKNAFWLYVTGNIKLTKKRGNEKPKTTTFYCAKDIYLWFLLSKMSLYIMVQHFYQERQKIFSC